MDNVYLNNIVNSLYIDNSTSNNIKTLTEKKNRFIELMEGTASYPNISLFKNDWDIFIKQLRIILQNFNSLISNTDVTKYSEEIQILINDIKNLNTAIDLISQPKKIQTSVKEQISDKKFIKELNNYKNLITKSFNSFVLKVGKVLKLDEPNTLNYLKQLRIPNIKITNVSNFINSLQLVSKVPDVVMSPANTSSQPTTIPTNSTTGTVNPTTATTITPTPVPQSIGPSTNVPSGVNSKASQNDIIKYIPVIVNKAIDVIIHTVKLDTAHSREFFNKPLPNSWVSEDINDIENLDNIDQDATSSGDVGSERAGEFLYNFRSNLRKRLGFSILIDPKNDDLKKITLNNKEYPFEVWWNNDDHQNDIYVRIKFENSSKDFLIMRFWDHDVNPKTGVLQQGNPNEFSIDKLVKSVIPSAQLYSVSSELNSKKEDFFRSLYAVIARKSMEFKAKRNNGQSVTIGFPEDRMGIIIKNNNKTEKITSDQLKQLLMSTNKQQNSWINLLTKIGYFDKFPDMKPKKLDNIPEFKKTVDILIKSGKDETTAMILVKNAWNELGAEGINSTQITTDKLLDKINRDLKIGSKIGSTNDLIRWNNELQSNGLDTLNNVEQLKLLWNLKALFNQKNKRKLMDIDDPAEKEKFEKEMIIKSPIDSNQLEWWKLAIQQVKKMTNTSESKYINPFQKINFL